MPDTFKIFLIFLKLGCTSFGGPVAHLGYFHDEFVRRRQLLSEADYADLVALCQFLPGPASSQVGMGIGYRLDGLRGALAAFVGFTLPSAVIMIAAALSLQGNALQQWGGVMHGLMIAAAVIIGHAVMSMSKSLLKTPAQFIIAIVAAGVLLAGNNPWLQLPLLAVGGLIGWLTATRTDAIGKIGNPDWRYLAAFAGLLALTFVLPDSLYAGIYRAGALVFGGGHVVLPLLEGTVVPHGLLSIDKFMAGYGLAQAVPGPLFSFAGFLGAAVTGDMLGGLLGLAAIFLPALLVLLGTLQAWESLRSSPRMRAAMSGINAAVVGILLAAWINPVISTAIRSPFDTFVAASAFGVLLFLRAPAWAIVLFCVLASL